MKSANPTTPNFDNEYYDACRKKKEDYRIDWVGLANQRKNSLTRNCIDLLLGYYSRIEVKQSNDLAPCLASVE